MLAVLLLPGCVATHVRAVEKSMEPTIHSGEFVSLDEYAYTDRGPRRGDIISFAAPADEELECGEFTEGSPCAAPASRSDEASFIKRVIALPGDTIAIDREGRAILNGVDQPERYVIPCRPDDGCELPKPITVPEGHYFVMGDNRPYSGDSRDFGPISEEALEGRVTPPER